MALNKEEKIRYSRQMTLSGLGPEGQERLKEAKVLVVGCGGLGAPVLQYLTAAGIGTIGIIDDDKVELSNLHRQILFDHADIGRMKVDAAIAKLTAQNPFVTFKAYATRLTSDNALDILKDFDIIADGSDNFPTRYLVNDACVKLGKVNVYASVFQFEGQLSVFNQLLNDGSRGPNFRDLFPSPPALGLVPSCAEAGVIGVLPGILGTLQANEVIKLVAKMGEPLSGRFFTIDTLNFETRIIDLVKSDNNLIRTERSDEIELIDYDEFCKGSKTVDMQGIKEISAKELAARIDSGEIQLIDVRESYEYLEANIGGTLIPSGSILDHISNISKEKDVIVICQSGSRSEMVAKLLQMDYGYNNLSVLKGGLVSWVEEVDDSLSIY